METKNKLDWDGLPENFRVDAVEMVPPKDRARFAQFGRTADQDVKNSINYIEVIKVISDSESPEIYIGHDEDGEKDFKDFDYVLKFTSYELLEISTNCWRWWDTKLLYSDVIESSDSVEQVFLNKCKHYLINYGRCLRKLEIVGHLDWDMEEVPSFRRLRFLETKQESIVETVLNKSGPFLRRIRLNDERKKGDELSGRLSHCEKIYDVDNLYLPKTVFTDEQFNRLTASEISIPVGQISVQCLIDMTHKLCKGSLSKNFSSLTIRWNENEFDIGSFFAAFDRYDQIPAEYDESFFTGFDIQQTCQNPKTISIALFKFDYFMLTIGAFQQRSHQDVQID